MKKLFARFAKDESGATAIEYGLIAGLIGVVIIGAVSAVRHLDREQVQRCLVEPELIRLDFAIFAASSPQAGNPLRGRFAF